MADDFYPRREVVRMRRQDFIEASGSLREGNDLQEIVKSGMTAVDRILALKAAVPFSDDTPSPPNVTLLGPDLEDEWRYRYNRVFLQRRNNWGEGGSVATWKRSSVLPASAAPTADHWAAETQAWVHVMRVAKHVSEDRFEHVRKLWRLRKVRYRLERVIKRVCRVPAGSSGGGQFAPCGGSGGGSVDSRGYSSPVNAQGVWEHPAMPVGTAGPLKSYVKAMGELKAAIGAGDVTAILRIKGPYATHNYGKKFEQYRAEALGYVRGGRTAVVDAGAGAPPAAPTPAPAPPKATPAPSPSPAPVAPPSASGAAYDTPRPRTASGFTPVNALAPALGPAKFEAVGANGVLGFPHQGTPDFQAALIYGKALQFVAQVHGLPGGVAGLRLKVDAIRAGSSALARYTFNAGRFLGGRMTPVGFGIQTRLPTHQIEIESAAHEFGHFMDTVGLGYASRKVTGGGIGAKPRSGFHSDDPPTPAYKNLMKAINDSDAVKGIQAIRAQHKAGTPIGKYARYLNSNPEKFARAYAQWVVTKHAKRDPSLANHFEFESGPNRSHRQWSAKDFEKIGQAFDDLAKEQGWN